MTVTLDDAAADPQQIIADLRRQLAERTAELQARTADQDNLERQLAAAEEQQTATAEVLQVINSSPGNLVAVFDAMLEKALRLCEAPNGHFNSYDGEFLHAVAVRGEPHYVQSMRRRGPVRPGPGRSVDQFLKGERFVHIADVQADEFYRPAPPDARTGIWVPLRKENTLLGLFHAYRTEVRPFTDKQIALLENFAAQAVIAMENARLITETREALEQQTATAEVLGVINSSPGDVAPVFEAILEKAHALCGAPLGSLVLYDGERLRAVATRGYPQAYDRLARQGLAPDEAPHFLRLRSGDAFIQRDLAGPIGPDSSPLSRAAAEIAGVRTALLVPLRKEADARLHQRAAARGPAVH
jgi:GAF domain-containing protein